MCVCVISIFIQYFFFIERNGFIYISFVFFYLDCLWMACMHAQLYEEKEKEKKNVT